ncbi:MAG: regulatory protein RecX [Bdellovibrionales bacterium]
MAEISEPESPRALYARAQDALTRYLALRDHSRFELRTKLLRRFPPEVVDRVLAEADENGWLPSEEIMAKRAVESYERKLKSRRYIEGQLRKRGLPVPDATTASEFEPEVEEESVEVQKARALVERKFGAHKLSFEERAKAFRYLKYRGFEDRWIRQVLSGKS